MLNVVCNELAHIQRPPETVRSPYSAKPTLASHPTLRRTLLLKGALGRRTWRANLANPSRPMLIRCIRVLQPEGIGRFHRDERPRLRHSFPLPLPADGVRGPIAAFMGTGQDLGTAHDRWDAQPGGREAHSGIFTTPGRAYRC